MVHSALSRHTGITDGIVGRGIGFRHIMGIVVNALFIGRVVAWSFLVGAAEKTPDEC
jgi:hypothetical protein